MGSFCFMSFNTHDAPNLYRFPDFVLKVSGNPSPVREAVDNLFRLFHSSTNGSCRQIEMHIWDLLDNTATVLPEFISQYLNNPDVISEPTMIQGENVSVGFVHSHGDVFTACYYMPENSRIEYVAIRRSYSDSALGTETALCMETTLCITSVLVPLLREIILENRQVLFHSAAIACPDGTGMLLFADSGGGKTTTSLSLMRLGAKLLGDDLVMVGKENDTLLLHGFPEPLNLTEQTISFFDELAHLKSTATPVGSKVVFTPQDVYGLLCFQEQVPLNVAYIVHKSPGTPHVEPLSTHEALGFLVRAHTFARCQSISRIALDRMYQILDSICFYRLYTGSEPVTLGKWLLDSAYDHARNKHAAP